MGNQTDEFGKSNYKEKEVSRFKGANIFRRNPKEDERS